MNRHPVRLVAAIAVLALAACTPSTGGQATGQPVRTGAPASASASADMTATIEVLDFDLDPKTLSVSGTTLALTVTNAGPTVHNVKVRDDAGMVLFGSRDLREGESETVTHAIAPGTYDLFCSLAGHESLGIKGTLTVTAP